jgi:hypothetical protein
MPSIDPPPLKPPGVMSWRDCLEYPPAWDCLTWCVWAGGVTLLRGLLGRRVF